MSRHMQECYIDTDGALCIVTSFCEEGELHRLIRAKSKANEFFREDAIMDMFIQIASALMYIHSKKVECLINSLMSYSSHSVTLRLAVGVLSKLLVQLRTCRPFIFTPLPLTCISTLDRCYTET